MCIYSFKEIDQQSKKLVMKFDSVNDVPKSDTGTYVVLKNKKYKIVSMQSIQKDTIAENHATANDTEFEIIVKSADDEVSDTND